MLSEANGAKQPACEEHSQETPFSSALAAQPE